MKRLTLTLFLALLIISSSALANKAIKVEREFGPSFVGYAPNKCIVIFEKDFSPVQGKQALADIADRFQITRFARQFPAAKASHPVDEPLTRYYKAHFPEGRLEAVMEAYRQLPFVERVEPVGLYRMTATPNDFYYDSSTTSFPYMQWHYWDSYGINVDSAWDKETGDPDVIVAVIDGGVRYYHYELGGTNPPGPSDNSTNGNIWVNDGETPGNSIDDDNNGYIDDVIGWDFVESASWCNDADCSVADNDPADHGGHGTHVSGTIAAITNNDPNWGVAGVAGGWNNGTTNDTASGVKIMCLRAGWTSIFGGLISMDYVSEAMYYVATMVDKGYNVTAINCSWGSSSLIADATDAVLARDVMVIVAVGNDNSSSCDYLGCREDCLDVGATDKYGNPASFSNYGTWVDIAAPGVQILSTYHNSNDPDYDYIALMDGTSMSCPHVVGVAGLLESYNSSLTGPQKFDIIVNNYKPYNMTKYVGAGIVDAGKCIDAAGPACDVTADFTADVLSGCAPLTVQFTDQSTGPVTSWDWDFGDGGSSQAQNPSHQYQNPGTYTVQLIVCSATCCDTMTKVDYITVSGVPVAEFEGSPTTGEVPLTVDFSDLSTGNPTGWLWYFGDGDSSLIQDPTHIYNDTGKFTVTLTATNSCGSDVETKVDYITVNPSSAQVMHVASIVVTRENIRRNFYRGVATIIIHDQFNEPVSGATVYADYTGPTSGSTDGVTIGDGSVVLYSSSKNKPQGEWCFEVTDVVKSGSTYDPGSNIVTKACESGPVYRKLTDMLPRGFTLTNYPNPFNATTTIEMTLPESSRWTISIYNIIGQKIADFSGYSTDGIVRVNWDASRHASGVYFYKGQARTSSLTKKMVFMK